MKKLLLLLILIFIGNSFTTYAQNDFPYDKYKTRTLSEIVAANSDLTTGDIFLGLKRADKPPGKDNLPQMILYQDFLSSQVRVRFMNKSRPISVERKELLKTLQKTYQLGQEEVYNSLENEYLFKECNDEYWIPVQKQVASFFPKELKEGDMISLYVVRVAGRQTDNKWDWLFLANEFEKY